MTRSEAEEKLSAMADTADVILEAEDCPPGLWDVMSDVKEEIEEARRNLSAHFPAEDSNE